ncbi:hypothetical protein KR054_002910, partial [Drosophila jambulina]
ILNFMKDNPDLAKGFSKGDKVASDAKWADLCSALNGIGPSTKDVWCDWKGTIRKKLAKNRADLHATGGVPYSQVILTDVEEEVAIICSLYAMADGVNSTKYGVPSTVGPVANSNVEEEAEESLEMPCHPNIEHEPRPKCRRTYTAQDLQSVCESQKNILSQLNTSIADHFKKMEELQALAVQKEDLELKKQLLD